MSRRRRRQDSKAPLALFGVLAVAVLALVVALTLHDNEPGMSTAERERVEAQQAALLRQQADDRAEVARKALRADQVVLNKTEQPNPHLLFLGDSLTGGYGATDFDLSFFRLTVKWLEREGLRPDVSKINEADVKRGVEINDVTPLLPTVADHAPFDLVVLELGSNNGTNDDYQADDAYDDYKRLLVTIKRTSPSVQFLCLGPWGSAGDAGRVHAGVAEACDNQGGVFRTLSGLYAVAGNRYVDGKMPDGAKIDNFHPTDQGYRMIFDRIKTGIRVKH